MIIFHWMLEYFLDNMIQIKQSGEYFRNEMFEIEIELKKNKRLLYILNREIQAGVLTVGKIKIKYDNSDMMMMKKEAVTTVILIDCLEYMLYKGMNIVHFCLKYKLNINKFFVRLKNTDVPFTITEIEKLTINNIINIK